MGCSVAPIMGVSKPLNFADPSHIDAMRGLLDQVEENTITAEEVKETFCNYVFCDRFLDFVDEDPHEALVHILLEWAIFGEADGRFGGNAKEIIGENGQVLPERMLWLEKYIKDTDIDDHNKDYVKAIKSMTRRGRR